MGLHLPPTIALFLTVGFIIFLFRRDIRERPNVTSALWLPLLWLVLISTRSPTQWLSLGGYVRGASMEEGNPLDALIYATLIAAGIYVLNKRHIQLSEIIRNNQWLTIFFVYCFLAVLWSDFPFIAFKRWIKIIGHPVLALVLLTEPDPQEAITRLMKRSAYVLVPVSILLIKYYDALGRGFDPWTGEAMNNGMMENKNGLGVACMILGLFFFWHLLQTIKMEKGKARRNELLLTVGFIYMIWWLLAKSSSATSLLSLLLGGLVVMLLGLRSVSKRLIGTYVILVAITLVIGQLGFGIFEHTVNLTGHNTTLAGRGELWRELLALRTNPIIGVGFESFWLGDRLRAISAMHWWHPTEAHNGYLETYLNLGLAGLGILMSLLIATFWKIRLELLRNLQFGRFRLGFLTAIVVYNWTEAAFKGLSPVWFVFYIIAMDYPRPQFSPVEQFSEVTDTEMQLADFPDRL